MVYRQMEQNGASRASRVLSRKWKMREQYWNVVCRALMTCPPYILCMVDVQIRRRYTLSSLVFQAGLKVVANVYALARHCMLFTTISGAVSVLNIGGQLERGGHMTLLAHWCWFLFNETAAKMRTKTKIYVAYDMN